LVTLLVQAREEEKEEKRKKTEDKGERLVDRVAVSFHVGVGLLAPEERNKERTQLFFKEGRKKEKTKESHDFYLRESLRPKQPQNQRIVAKEIEGWGKEYDYLLRIHLLDPVPVGAPQKAVEWEKAHRVKNREKEKMVAFSAQPRTFKERGTLERAWRPPLPGCEPPGKIWGGRGRIARIERRRGSPPGRRRQKTKGRKTGI